MANFDPIERLVAERDALAATLDAIRKLLETASDERGVRWWEWIDGGLGGTLAHDLRALLATAPADHLSTVKAEHVVRQVPPWPPYPEADYMLSRWECECGWSTGAFRDVKGHPDVARFRALADEHVVEYRTERGEPSLIPCPHWNPGSITMRKGCTACEANRSEQEEQRNG